MATAILGAGIAGLAAAYGLDRAALDATVFEAKPFWGGHTHSNQLEGFWFDEGPHVSFTGDKRVQAVFERSTNGEFTDLNSRIACHYEGHWLPNPPQVNLYGLESNFVAKCIADLADTTRNPEATNNYADWLTAAYGRTFADNFPRRYTRKYWTVDAAEMSIDWIRNRMYVPTVEEVVLGALRPARDSQFHYLKTYRYPKFGGFQTFLDTFARTARIDTRKEAVRVDVSSKEIYFSDGAVSEYDSIISTIPLDRLVGLIAGVTVPTAVLAAAQELLCTSVILIELGVTHRPKLDFDWFYSYDEDVSFSRASFPHNLAPSMTPPGLGSIQAEVYYSRKKPLTCTPDELIPRVIEELRSLDVIAGREDVLVARARRVPYANVVYDHRRTEALNVIKPFIEQIGISLAGRYAEWEYYWTDDAVNSGWRAAASVAGVSLAEMIDDD